MDMLQILFFVVFGAAIVAGAYILIAKPVQGYSILAAILCAIFVGYTAIQIMREGVVMFFTNHSANLTGLQVWWDLVMCVVIALFFITPRARAAGMNVPLWIVIVGSTASIGLLAMCARLFALERAATAHSA